MLLRFTEDPNADYFTFFQPKKNSVIFDVGATKGDFANRVLQFEPSLCLSIEASPVNHAQLADELDALNSCLGKEVFFPVLCALTANIDDKYLLCETGGAWDNMTCPFVCASSAAEDNGPNRTLAISLLALCAKHGVDSIDFFKIDIEGGEFDIFQNEASFALIAQKVSSIAVEFHLHFLRDIMKMTPQDAAQVLINIIEKFENAGFDTLLSFGRDYAGIRHTNAGIFINTCCIDFWAIKRS